MGKEEEKCGLLFSSNIVTGNNIIFQVVFGGVLILVGCVLVGRCLFKTIFVSIENHYQSGVSIFTPLVLTGMEFIFFIAVLMVLCFRL